MYPPNPFGHDPRYGTQYGGPSGITGMPLADAFVMPWMAQHLGPQLGFYGSQVPMYPHMAPGATPSDVYYSQKFGNQILQQQQQTMAQMDPLLQAVMPNLLNSSNRFVREGASFVQGGYTSMGLQSQLLSSQAAQMVLGGDLSQGMRDMASSAMYYNKPALVSNFQDMANLHQQGAASASLMAGTVLDRVYGQTDSDGKRSIGAVPDRKFLRGYESEAPMTVSALLAQRGHQQGLVEGVDYSNVNGQYSYTGSGRNKLQQNLSGVDKVMGAMGAATQLFGKNSADENIMNIEKMFGAELTPVNATDFEDKMKKLAGLAEAVGKNAKQLVEVNKAMGSVMYNADTGIGSHGTAQSLGIGATGFSRGGVLETMQRGATEDWMRVVGGAKTAGMNLSPSQEADMFRGHVENTVRRDTSTFGRAARLVEAANLDGKIDAETYQKWQEATKNGDRAGAFKLFNNEIKAGLGWSSQQVERALNDQETYNREMSNFAVNSGASASELDAADRKARNAILGVEPGEERQLKTKIVNKQREERVRDLEKRLGMAPLSKADNAGLDKAGVEAIISGLSEEGKGMASEYAEQMRKAGKSEAQIQTALLARDGIVASSGGDVEEAKSRAATARNDAREARAMAEIKDPNQTMAAGTALSALDRYARNTDNKELQKEVAALRKGGKASDADILGAAKRAGMSEDMAGKIFAQARSDMVTAREMTQEKADARDDRNEISRSFGGVFAADDKDFNAFTGAVTKARNAGDGKEERRLIAEFAEKQTAAAVAGGQTVKANKISAGANKILLGEKGAQYEAVINATRTTNKDGVSTNTETTDRLIEVARTGSTMLMEEALDKAALDENMEPASREKLKAARADAVAERGKVLAAGKAAAYKEAWGSEDPEQKMKFSADGRAGDVIGAMMKAVWRMPDGAKKDELMAKVEALKKTMGGDSQMDGKVHKSLEGEVNALAKDIMPGLDAKDAEIKALVEKGDLAGAEALSRQAARDMGVDDNAWNTTRKKQASMFGGEDAAIMKENEKLFAGVKAKLDKGDNEAARKEYVEIMDKDEGKAILEARRGKAAAARTGGGDKLVSLDIGAVGNAFGGAEAEAARKVPRADAAIDAAAEGMAGAQAGVADTANRPSPVQGVVSLLADSMRDTSKLNIKSIAEAAGVDSKALEESGNVDAALKKYKSNIEKRQEGIDSGRIKGDEIGTSMLALKTERDKIAGLVKAEGEGREGRGVGGASGSTDRETKLNQDSIDALKAILQDTANNPLTVMVVPNRSGGQSGSPTATPGFQWFNFV